MTRVSRTRASPNSDMRAKNRSAPSSSSRNPRTDRGRWPCGAVASPRSSLNIRTRQAVSRSRYCHVIAPTRPATTISAPRSQRSGRNRRYRAATASASVADRASSGSSSSVSASTARSDGVSRSNWVAVVRGRMIGASPASSRSRRGRRLSRPISRQRSIASPGVHAVRSAEKKLLVTNRPSRDSSCSAMSRNSGSPSNGTDPDPITAGLSNP